MAAAAGADGWRHAAGMCEEEETTTAVESAAQMLYLGGSALLTPFSPSSSAVCANQGSLNDLKLTPK